MAGEASAPREPLGWVPTAQNLTEALGRASLYASEQAHRHLTLEHLLLALTEDDDAVSIFQANNIDTGALQNDLAGHVGSMADRLPLDENSDPVPDQNIRRIFDYASAAAQKSNRGTIDGAMVVAAMIGEGQSPAAQFLQHRGLTFHQAIKSLRSTGIGGSAMGSREPNSPPGPPGVSAAELASAHELLQSDGSNPMPNAWRPSAGKTQTPHPQTPRDIVVPREQPQIQRTRPRAHYPAPAGRPETKTAPPNGSSAEVRPPLTDPHPAITRHPPTPSSQTADSLPTADAPRSPQPPDAVDQARPTIVGMIDRESLVEILPDKMRVGTPEIIELRIARADIETLAGQMQGRDVEHAEHDLVSRAMSVRLRSPSGNFSIEPRSPEVQWIDSHSSVLDDESASWRWQVTPQMRGPARMQLIASARTVTSDGTAMEMALPNQNAELHVRRNLARSFRRFAAFMFVFAAGCALGVFAYPIYRMAVNLTN